MTALTGTVRLPRAITRDYVAAGTYVALGLLDMLLFTRHKGDATFALSLPGAGVQVPNVHVPAAPAALALGAVCVAAGIVRALSWQPPGRQTWSLDMPRWGKRLAIAVVLLSSLFAMLCWAAAGSTSSMNLVDLTSATVVAAIPIVLGALSGIMCERSGVINIAIEGQLLTGAFAAAMVSSTVGATTGLWIGTLAGSLTGGLVGALLAVMAIRYLTDQIIIGVVINVLALGFTNYLYNRVMQTYTNFNTGNFFTPYKIPLLGDIPIIGPTFFDSTVFLYITYILLIVIQVALFRTRYGLRVRAVGEHPTAADTVGIKVLWTRYRNVILGGMVAGIGGAWLTVGSTGQFNAGMSNGIGYIGLAAMIFGRWRPVGAVAAALLFGFCGQLAIELEVLAVPIPPQILSMAPYVATVIAVAGLVGKVRAPAADGKPYVKA
jgi:simple sugar transport system permease protein